MNTNSELLLYADIILYVHFAFVLFVVLGLILTVIGGLVRWQWIGNPWFRYTHLFAIGIVVVQSWLGAVCPLTVWESALREQAGQAGYAGSFIAAWVQKLMFYQAPEWVFMILYTLFAALVVATWFWLPPRSLRRRLRR